MAYADTGFGLSQILISSFSISLGTYGATPQSLLFDHVFEFEPQADTDDMRDSGAIVRGITVPTHCTFTMRGGGINATAMPILCGATYTNSATTPNRIGKVTTPSGPPGLPYFGMIGVARADDGGLVAVGHQACKLDAVPGMSFDGESNKYLIREMSGRTFPIGGTLFTVKTYETAADFTAPTDAATFLAFFA